MLLLSKPFTPQVITYGVVIGNGSYGSGDNYTNSLHVEYYVDGVKYSREIDDVLGKSMGDRVKIRYEINNPDRIISQEKYIIGWVALAGCIVLSIIMIRMALNGKADYYNPR
jgi:hypothetical protein